MKGRLQGSYVHNVSITLVYPVVFTAQNAFSFRSVALLRLRLFLQVPWTLELCTSTDKACTPFLWRPFSLSLPLSLSFIRCHVCRGIEKFLRASCSCFQRIFPIAIWASLLVSIRTSFELPFTRLLGIHLLPRLSGTVYSCNSFTCVIGYSYFFHQRCKAPVTNAIIVQSLNQRIE